MPTRSRHAVAQVRRATDPDGRAGRHHALPVARCRRPVPARPCPSASRHFTGTLTRRHVPARPRRGGAGRYFRVPALGGITRCAACARGRFRRQPPVVRRRERRGLPQQSLERPVSDANNGCARPSSTGVSQRACECRCSRAAVKRIRRPSGDQAGFKITSGVLHSLRTWLPSLSATSAVSSTVRPPKKTHLDHLALAAI
jgi:hypothetical protein